MFRSNYKATLKTLVRHPAIIIAFVLVILTIVLHDYKGMRLNPIIDLLHMSMRTTWIDLFPPLLGIIMASNILSEITNGFSDVLSASNLSFRKFMLSKILAFWTVSIVAHLVYSLVWCGYIWRAQNILLGGSAEEYGFIRLLSCLVIFESAYLPLSLLVATAISLVSIAITQKSVFGAVCLLAYTFLEEIFVILQGSPAVNNVLGGILYYIPKQLMVALFYFCENVPWTEYVWQQSTAERYLYPEKIVLSVVFHYVFSILLIIISYSLLKKRYNVGVRIRNV